MKRKIVAIVQARMSSQRLPGKVLLPLAGDCALGALFKRLSFSESISEVVLATSGDSTDDELEYWALQRNIRCFRGPLEDVLERFRLIAHEMCPDLLLRITGDCPLIDAALIDRVITGHIRLSPELTATNNENGFPRGLDVEVFEPELLEKISAEHPSREDREHVTLHAYHYYQGYKISIYQPHPTCRAFHSLRLCLDTPEDYRRIEAIFEHFLPRIDFSLIDILKYAESNSILLENQARQKVTLDFDAIGSYYPELEIDDSMKY